MLRAWELKELHGNTAVVVSQTQGGLSCVLVLTAGGVAVLSTICGASVGIAAVQDLVGIAVLPLTVAHAAMAALLRWQLVAMHAMWRLLRGQATPPRPSALLRWAL